jgi:glycosyltransferase involved in cell wall biosynthesis
MPEKVIGEPENETMEMKIAFIAGLSDKKLIEKIQPLIMLNKVYQIDLYRRFPIEYKGVNWISIPYFFQKNLFLSELFRFGKLLLLANKYDLVIGCNQINHGLFAYIIGLIFHTPVIQIVTTDIDSVLKNPITRIILLSSDCCGVRGEISKQKLTSAGYKGDIEIIANVYPFIQESSKKLPKEYDLVFVAHYPAKAKDIPWLLKVLQFLIQRCPHIKIAIIGKGHKEKYYFEIEKTGLSNNVVFLGELHNDDLNDAYMKSKLFILTSKVEGLPMVLIEAMSFGLPVIVTDVGDIPWIVRDGIEGYLIKNGMTEQMVDAIVNLLKDSEKRKILGENSRKRYNEIVIDFQPEVIEKSWEKLISRLS